MTVNIHDRQRLWSVRSILCVFGSRPSKLIALIFGLERGRALGDFWYLCVLGTRGNLALYYNSSHGIHGQGVLALSGATLQDVHLNLSWMLGLVHGSGELGLEPSWDSFSVAVAFAGHRSLFDVSKLVVCMGASVSTSYLADSAFEWASVDLR